MFSGTRLSINQRCSVACRRANIGKALKIASATVNSGTSEIVVVKVRLDASHPQPVFAEAFAQCQRRVAPGKAQQVLPKGGQQGLCAVQALGKSHPGIMPPAP